MNRAGGISGLAIMLAGSFILTALLSGHEWGGSQMLLASVVGLTAWIGWAASELRRSRKGTDRG